MSAEGTESGAPNGLEGRGRVGLALGRGAAKGWSHIGVIRRREARGVHPEIVCGTSMGAVVGAAYAAGRLVQSSSSAHASSSSSRPAA